MFPSSLKTGRRSLLKLSPLAVAAASTSVGRLAFGQTQAPSLAAEAVFNVRTYGAAGDGKTVDTPAINRAIEAVAAAGGGSLVSPAGTYMCFDSLAQQRRIVSFTRLCHSRRRLAQARRNVRL